MKDGHSFVSVELDGTLREALSGAQQALQSGARRAGQRFEPVPRRYLQLVLDDLGPCPVEAVEAVEVAVDRARGRHPPCSVQVVGVRQTTLPDGRALVWAAVTDDRDRLSAVRADLHAALAGYGFPVVEGPWAPHVPLGVADAPLPADLLPDHAYGRLPVRRLTLFRRDLADPRGPRFRRSWRRALQAAPAADEAADLAAWRAEIAAQLDARLAERAAALPRTPRRRKRAQRGDAH
ncbi:MAG: 2'-5' RNA ligase family protein [Myxococcales bacterium]|nr:2'-5' RNA ligase family protein [Myxococcales bacterium]